MQLLLFSHLMILLLLYHQGIESVAFAENHLHPKLTEMPICDNQSFKKHLSTNVEKCAGSDINVLQGKHIAVFFLLSFQVKDIDTLDAVF